MPRKNLQSRKNVQNVIKYNEKHWQPIQEHSNKNCIAIHIIILNINEIPFYETLYLLLCPGYP